MLFRSNSKFHSKKINENLASVATACKRLAHLRVHCDGQMPGGISFQKFWNLRSAYIENAYSCGDGLTMLNSLDHLEYFKETFYDTFQQSRTPLPPLSSTLPALHTLHIGTIPLYTMHQFLSSLNAPLSDVRTNITDVRFFSEVTQLFDTLCSPRNATSLHTVDVSFIILDWPDGRFERPGPSSFLKLTAPLLCLQSLASLRVHLSRQPWGVIEYDATDAVRAWHGALAIDNAALKTMARAWPRLRHLVLTYSSEFTFMDAVAAVAAQDSPDAAAAARPPPGPSLGAVVDVALACPDLKEFEMKVADVSEDDLKLLEARAEMDGARQTALVDLYLQGNRSEDSPQLPDLDRLAVALHRVFPKLRGTGPPLPIQKGDPSDITMESDLQTLLKKLYALSIDNRVP